MTVRLGDKIIMPTNNVVRIETKYGATAGSLLGDVDANGILQMPSEATDLVFTGVKDVVAQGMYYKFNQNTGIKSVSFPDLTTVSTTNAMSYAFYGASFLESAIFAKLATVSGSNGIARLFYNCTSLTTASMPLLATLSGSSCAQYLFYGCPLTTFTFIKLSDVSGNACLSYAFNVCRDLTSLCFPALTTTSFGSRVNQFSSMFNSNTAYTSGAFTVHFPSNLQSIISGLTGYPTFGANSARITLLFDLPATS